MEYRREIDGLRALAVVPVILFHAGLQIFSGGFVGVDVFFVISGHLITSIILAEKQAGTFTILGFYERRARRILPALFVVMFACLPFAWLWLLPADMSSFSQSLVAVSGFLSNVLFYSMSGYFETSAELKPLLHTWSLAVEEQYYVIFPVFLLLTWSLGKRWIVSMLAVAAVTSLAAAQWASVTHPSFAFYLLPTRGWEILTGAFVAFYTFPRSGRPVPEQRVGELLGSCGLLLIVYAVFAFDRQTPFPSSYTLVPTIGTALILLFATRKTLVGKLLGSKPFVGVGLISYSAYLWHQPLFAFARHRSLYEPSKALLAALALVAVGLAYCSWRYVEIPFRDRKRFTRNQVFSLGAVGSALFVGIGAAGFASKGYPGRVPAAVERLPEMDVARIDNGWCFYSVASIGALPIGAKGLNCRLGDKSSSRRGLLFGDSFAGQYEPLWDIVGTRDKSRVDVVTTNWCHPSAGADFAGPVSTRAREQCLYNRRYVLENLPSYDFVVLGGNWGTVLQKNELGGVLELMALASARTKLVVIMPSPTLFDADVAAIYKRAAFFKLDFRIEDVTRESDKVAAAANEQLKEAAKRFQNVLFVDRDSLFNVDGRASDLTKENIPFSSDGSHISIYGSRAAAGSFIASREHKVLDDVLSKI